MAKVPFPPATWTVYSSPSTLTVAVPVAFSGTVISITALLPEVMLSTETLTSEGNLDNSTVMLSLAEP